MLLGVIPDIAQQTTTKNNNISLFPLTLQGCNEANKRGARSQGVRPRKEDRQSEINNIKKFATLGGMLRTKVTSARDSDAACKFAIAMAEATTRAGLGSSRKRKDRCNFSRTKRRKKRSAKILHQGI